jgi:hypothetical protein
MEEKSKIHFKPLHEGMGFHPFSDGLPYAPESKSKYSSGSGATSAGRPQFANPTLSGPALAPATSSQPKVTARQLQERNANAHIPITRHEPISRAPIANPAAEAKAGARVNIAPTIETSLIRKRAFAYLLDTVIHAGFWLAVNLTALFFFKFQVDAEIVRDNFGQFLVFFLTSQWMFIALQEILFENSIGKVFFNLEFKRSHHSLFLRSIVFMIGAICLVGFYFRPQDRLGEIQLKSTLYA